jgi:hypothetical protein
VNIHFKKPPSAPVGTGVAAPSDAEWTHRDLRAKAKAECSGLRVGTSLERISDESLTLDDSGFVHPNILKNSWQAAPHADSLKWPVPDSAPLPLTFAGKVAPSRVKPHAK